MSHVATSPEERQADALERLTEIVGDYLAGALGMATVSFRLARGEDVHDVTTDLVRQIEVLQHKIRVNAHPESGR